MKYGNSSYTAAIVPVHNRAMLVGKAIASIQQQTRPIDEIVVVDDASTDETPDAVMRLAGQDRRIRLVVLSKNGGASAARNVGVDSTQCDWISFLDSDDQWMSEKHEKQVNALASHPDAIASFTGIRFQHTNDYFDRRAPCQINLHDLRKLNYLSTTSTAMIRREIFKKVDGFDSTLLSCQDWDLWLRLRSIGDFAIVPEPLVVFNQTEQTRISLNRAAVLSGHHQVFARSLSSISARKERRIITAYHHVRLAQIYLWDFKEPIHAVVPALKSMLLHRTQEGKALLKEALQTIVPTVLRRAVRNGYIRPPAIARKHLKRANTDQCSRK